MNTQTKPMLRGHFHQAGFFIALGACVLLLANIQHWNLFVPTLIYAISLMTLFGVSALYHRINWSVKKRMLMRRLDHAAIYFLIVGTMWPISAATLPTNEHHKLLLIAWVVAGSGIIFSIFFTKKPKWVNAIIYMGASFVVLPYLSAINRELGQLNALLIIIGGGIYIAGALIYAFKKPNFFPQTLGYHEIFHICVMVGAALHFYVIHGLI